MRSLRTASPNNASLLGVPVTRCGAVEKLNADGLEIPANGLFGRPLQRPIPSSRSNPRRRPDCWSDHGQLIAGKADLARIGDRNAARDRAVGGIAYFDVSQPAVTTSSNVRTMLAPTATSVEPSVGVVLTSNGATLSVGTEKLNVVGEEMPAKPFPAKSRTTPEFKRTSVAVAWRKVVGRIDGQPVARKLYLARVRNRDARRGCRCRTCDGFRCCPNLP